MLIVYNYYEIRFLKFIVITSLKRKKNIGKIATYGHNNIYLLSSGHRDSVHSYELKTKFNQ